MSEGMLGTLPLSEIRGPRSDLEDKLASKNGRLWLAAFNRFLRMENPWPATTLYLHPEQEWEDPIDGFGLLRRFRETGIISRCLSLGDSEITLWRDDPSTYPEEFKDRMVFLWESNDGRYVSFLVWEDDSVVLGSKFLGEAFDQRHLALVRTQETV